MVVREQLPGPSEENIVPRSASELIIFGGEFGFFSSLCRSEQCVWPWLTSSQSPGFTSSVGAIGGGPKCHMSK